MKCAEPDCGGIVVDGYCERLRYRARTRCTRRIATRLDRDGGERVCHSVGAHSVGANVPHWFVDEGQQSRPPRRRDRRDSAHSEGRPCRRDSEGPAGTGVEPVLR